MGNLFHLSGLVIFFFPSTIIEKKNAWVLVQILKETPQVFCSVDLIGLKLKQQLYKG